MHQYKIDKTREEIYEILINSKNKQEFVKAFNYKDSRSAKKICERFNLDIEDLGKNTKKRGVLLKTGDRFGLLVIIEPNCIKLGKKPEIASLCQCDCGEEIYVKNDFLKRGHTTSCGCKSGHNKRNMIKDGDIFEELTVLQANIGLNSHGDQTSLCRCSCGNEIIVYNNALRRGQISCGCVNSKGERKINQILSKMDIVYKTQYSFSNLKGDFKNLRFDFAIFNNQEKLQCLIEYQGEQHYKINPTYFGKKTQEYDVLKRKYCKEHNIPLIEIPYTQYNLINDIYLKELINNAK